MSAQVVIQKTSFLGGPDFDLAGIELVPLDTPEHQGAVKQILAEDAALVAPLLPYSVLLVNHSTRKLLAVGVEYHWLDAGGDYGGMQSVITYFSEGAKVTPVGGIVLFTPSHAANLYLSLDAAKRRKVPAGVGITPSTPLPTAVANEIAEITGPGPLPGYTKFRAAIDCVVFEDYQYIGSSNAFQLILRNHPEVHK
jgi:hypothetical protein